MHTHDLIKLLATQTEPVQETRFNRWASLLLAVAVAYVMMVVLYKLNPYLSRAIQSPWFWLRFTFIASLAAIAWLGVVQLGNPGRARRFNWAWLTLPFAVMLLIGGYLLFNAAPELRKPMLLGISWQVCSMSIAVIAIPLFVAGMWVARSFAPTRLRLTGAVVGLFAGAVAALIYNLHCPELSPAFLMIWYSLGMLIPAAVGALIAQLTLRW
jgi:hypothetical protein